MVSQQRDLTEKYESDEKMTMKAHVVAKSLLIEKMLAKFNLRLIESMLFFNHLSKLESLMIYEN